MLVAGWLMEMALQSDGSEGVRGSKLEPMNIGQ